MVDENKEEKTKKLKKPKKKVLETHTHTQKKTNRIECVFQVKKTENLVDSERKSDGKPDKKAKKVKKDKKEKRKDKEGA